MPTANTTRSGSEMANSSSAAPCASLPSRRRKNPHFVEKREGHEVNRAATPLKMRSPRAPLPALFENLALLRQSRIRNRTILVLHPALRLGRQNDLLQVERSERQVELKWILKAYDGSALRGLRPSRGIQQRIAADRDVAGRRACPRGIRGIRAEGRGRRIGVYRNLSWIDTGRLHHGPNRSCYAAIGTRHCAIAGRGVSARNARRACRDNCALLRRLLDRRINIEGPSKPDDAQQDREHQWQHQRRFGDLRPVSASELARDSLDVQQTKEPSLRPG